MAEGQPATLNSCEDAAAGRVQMPLSATCPQGEALGGEGSVGRGEVGLSEKEKLGLPSSSAQTQGLPCSLSPPPYPRGHSAWRPKKPCLLGAPHVIP